MTFQVLSGFALRPYEDFQSCGDGAFTCQDGSTQLFALVDALGHGPDAAKSAQKVCEVLKAAPGEPLSTLFAAADRSLAGQRGAVMSAIRVTDDSVIFAGVGNVDIFGPADAPRPACRPGTLGRGVRKIREEQLEVKPGDRWVLATDGIRAREVYKVLADITHLGAAEAAQVLIERAGRSNDDVGVVVIDFKEKS